MSPAAHAVRMQAYGPPEVLTWNEVALPPLAADEVRVRVTAAAVNHTDLEIRAGAWPIRAARPFPYVPGVEAVGVVAEIGATVSGWTVGQRVITMMQGLGGVRAERPGGYAEFVTISGDALAAVPASVDPFDIAALGLAGVTAHEGLRLLGALGGRRVLVTGAAGGVGSAAVAIARAQGASVIGLVSRPEQVDYVRGLGADSVEVVPRGRAPVLGACSVDGVLDTVGGALFEAYVAALGPGGTLSLLGAVGGSAVRLDLWELIRPIALTGYSSESLDGPALRQAIGTLGAWLAKGTITAPSRITMPLAEADRAHTILEGGGVSGRVLLVP
jgi:NADPH2:quinone reductase